MQWIKNNKKTALAVVAAFVLFIGFIWVTSTVFNNTPSVEGEEEEPVEGLVITNIDVLYNDFSDTIISTIINAVSATIKNGQSMKNGRLAANYVAPSTVATTEDLYPNTIINRVTASVENTGVTEYEDSWGIWNTFTLGADTGKRYKVDISVGAHNRENDLNYRQITVTIL